MFVGVGLAEDTHEKIERCQRDGDCSVSEQK